MALRERVEAIVGQRVVAVDQIPGAGGYTPALRRIATLADGSTVFVKAAVNDLTAAWLDTEKRSYESLAGAAFLPRYFGCDGQVLVTEDLRAGHWPPPWRPGDLDRVLAMLEDVGRHAPPEHVPDLALRPLWSAVAEDPAAFLALGVCTREWFDHSIATILDADGRCSLDGDALVHFDVRSDNLCLTEDRVVLIDWNGTARGRPDFDAHCLAPSASLESGIEPDELLPTADPALVAKLTGYFAFHAPLPQIPDAPRVRDIQLAQLRVCLPWMCRLLGL